MKQILKKRLTRNPANNPAPKQLSLPKCSFSALSGCCIKGITNNSNVPNTEIVINSAINFLLQVN